MSQLLHLNWLLSFMNWFNAICLFRWPFLEKNYIANVKVHIFWEGHKILRNLHLTFDYSTYSQKLVEDFAKSCGLLRIYELYNRGSFFLHKLILHTHADVLFEKNLHHNYCFFSSWTDSMCVFRHSLSFVRLFPKESSQSIFPTPKKVAKYFFGPWSEGHWR